MKGRKGGLTSSDSAGFHKTLFVDAHILSAGALSYAQRLAVFWARFAFKATQRWFFKITVAYV